MEPDTEVQMSDQSAGIGLDCPKCGKPLVTVGDTPLERDEQIAGRRCAECGHTLTEADIGAAMKKQLDKLMLNR